MSKHRKRTKTRKRRQRQKFRRLCTFIATSGLIGETEMAFHEALFPGLIYKREENAETDQEP